MRSTLIAFLALLTAACAPQSPLARAADPARTGSLVHDGGVAYAKQIPSRVSLPLPASLVAAGAGNYRLAAAAEPFSIATTMRDQVGIYHGVTHLIDDILKGITAADLQPGKPITFPDDGNPSLTAEQKRLPENQLTAKLDVLADHSVVSIFRGPAPAAAKQLIGISFTTKTKGVAVFHADRPDPNGSLLTLATTFDLDAGKASADGLGRADDGSKTRAHWEFRHFDGAPLAFSMRLSAYVVAPPKGERALYELSGNFQPDGSGAATAATLPYQLRDVLKGQPVFMPNDGTDPEPTNAKPHDLYIDAGGHDLAPASATAALKALVPPDDEIQKPFAQDPSDPANGDPQAAPVFAFPN
jgi:hypothetical protein